MVITTVVRTASRVSLVCAAAAPSLAVASEPPIDRHAVVSRHNVVLTALDRGAPVSVGNGEFAFNMDITGLQTFVPFNTMSHWGWHSGPTPAGTAAADYQMMRVDTHGRMVPYPLPDAAHPRISEWLASSPHRINLGRVGLTLTKRDGSPATDADLSNARQELDLWSGTVTSRFDLEGVAVVVTTVCDPKLDAVVARVESALIAERRLAVFVACPGNNPLGFANEVGDWSSPARLEQIGDATPRRADFKHRMDEHQSYVTLSWSGAAALRTADPPTPELTIVDAKYGANDHWVDVTQRVKIAARDGRVRLFVSNDLAEDPAPKIRKSIHVVYKIGAQVHEADAAEASELVIDAMPVRGRVVLTPDESVAAFSFLCVFSPVPVQTVLPEADASFRAAREKWGAYWGSGGAIDLSESTDPRWRELERRIVLSQYLMAVHEAGSLPPQESGLVNNGWFGRFHMEMYWWHAAHWALWNRWPELNRSTSIYDRLLPGAASLAEKQGYRGARWPKCVGPNLVEWPHEIHSFLVWQQPHPIFFAELDYRAHPTRATLERWRPVVEASADFMSSYAHLDPETRQYVLGPPIHLASENSPPSTTRNPTFELGYWRFGLRVAQEWRVRLGLPRRADWDAVLENLTPLPIQDDLYVLHEGVEDMWTRWNFEHPALVATLGVLPGDGVEPARMSRTLRKISATWNFDRTWGWDFPMLAMTAARTGAPSAAVDFLLHPAAGFQFDARGLATGGPFPYFPSNGGLLYAAAMMAAGWDGAPNRNAPGFPSDGTWKVRHEGLATAP